MRCLSFGAVVSRESPAGVGAVDLTGNGSAAAGRDRDDASRLPAARDSTARPAAVVGGVVGALVAGMSVIVYGVARVSGSRLLLLDEAMREAGVAKGTGITRGESESVQQLKHAGKDFANRWSLVAWPICLQIG